MLQVQRYQWRLRPNVDNTEVCRFHLNKKEVIRGLNVLLKEIKVNYNFIPKYLEVTLPRLLSFRTHIKKLQIKLKTRVNLVEKLAGSGLGADPTTLRTATIVLMYYTMLQSGRSAH